MNKVILLGRLVKDPEVKVTSNGKTFTRFMVAVNRRYASGEKHDADFISCKAWNKTAEFVGNYFGKGDRILIEDGSISTGSYEKNGEKHFTLEVLVNGVRFVDGKKKGGEQEPMKSFGSEVGFDEEVPF